MKQIKYKKPFKGFTLIELLVVIAIIGLLSSIIMVAVNGARDKARRVVALANIKQMQKALEMYYNDMGFYPPDVNRGWDPGLTKPLPYLNASTTGDCNINQASCICGTFLSCSNNTNPAPSYVPSDWMAKAQNYWRGPYIKWASSTPWGGVYDYNYWDTDADRGGCNGDASYRVPKGIYFGIESGGGWFFDLKTEQSLFNEGIDNDGCPSDGEAELLLMKL